jgi:hypothetical protein
MTHTTLAEGCAYTYGCRTLRGLCEECARKRCGVYDSVQAALTWSKVFFFVSFE